MKILDLELRPCLLEANLPIDQQLDLAMMDKIESKIAHEKKLARRKRRLAKILKQIGAAMSAEK